MCTKKASEQAQKLHGPAAGTKRPYRAGQPLPQTKRCAGLHIRAIPFLSTIDLHLTFQLNRNLIFNAKLFTSKIKNRH